MSVPVLFTQHIVGAIKVNEFSTKQALSRPRRQLLELMQRYPFCRLENLEVRGGEPVFDPAPRVIQEIKLGFANGSRPDLQKDDLQLPAQVIELFEHLQRVGNGRVAVIEVRHALPFRVMLEADWPRMA